MGSFRALAAKPQSLYERDATKVLVVAQFLKLRISGIRTTNSKNIKHVTPA